MKSFIIFNLFYLRFCFGPDVCIGNFRVKIFGVVPLGGSVRNIILLHTYMIFSQNFTNNFLSSHHSQFTCNILAASLSQTETDQILLSAVLVYRLAPSFAVYLSRGGFESLYIIFSYFVKERVTKTEIFQRLSKNA